VVITGLGAVSSLGCDLDKIWTRLVNGESGVGPTTRFDPARFTSKIAAEVKEFDLDEFISKKEQRRLDPFSHYGVGASTLAVRDAGLNMDQEDRDRVGVIIGTGIGGLQIMQDQSLVLHTKGPSRFSPFMIPQMIGNIVSGHVAIQFGMNGPNFTVTSACASGAHSIGEAFRMIQHNEADVFVAGGTEAPVCELGVGGFAAMRALSTKRNDQPTKASRPFDADRDGFVVAEGAGVVVLEELEHARRRGARIHCELAGYGRTCDAHHITAPLDDGGGAAKAMKLAMQDAGLNPDQIDYINAHGTSTELNDKAETRAIKTALGEARARQVMISSTKSMTGHLLGAAGSLETIFCAMIIQRGVIPPTINYETPDPDCDLDYVPNTARPAAVQACLNNSLGFGGHNACLCLRAFS
jgi:3-oxoacyl-[acyl-carrier-protein] synthase II